MGAPEGWEYPVASAEDLDSNQTPGSLRANSGKRILGRSLPSGRTVDEYGEQQIGPEQFIWRTNDTLIYAKNTVDDYVYSGDGYGTFQLSLLS